MAADRPQVYVNVSGGIAEVTVTRGDVEVIHIDWDNLDGDGDVTDLDTLEEARDEIEKVAQRSYRERLLADINALIEAHPEYVEPTMRLEDA